MNIGIKVDQAALRGLQDELKKMGKAIGSSNLQVHRAKRFKKYAGELVQRGEARLSPIHSATALISGDHESEWQTGFLLRYMKIKDIKAENAAEVGYFATDTTKMRGKKITVTEAAILQHTGYKIPVSMDTEKGMKVRGWLGKNYGIYLKKEKQYIIVKARPFFFNAVYSYQASDEDIKAVDEFLDKVEAGFSGAEE